jgi:hypothetical protein
MLSKNLYEIDEVVAALQLCLRMFWPRAHFWAHELVISEEEDLLRKTLRDAWLDYGAPADLALLIDLHWSDSNNAALVSRVMAAIQVTGSLAPLLLFNKGTGYRPRVTSATSDPTVLARRSKADDFLAATESENMDPEHLKAWWISFDSACRCHWFRDAFWLLQAVQPTLSSDGIWEGIMLAARGFPEVKDFIRELRCLPDQVRAQAAAVATLCYPSTNLPLPAKAQQVDWSQWSRSGRGARVYEIPQEDLHSQTTRGSLSTKYTNIQDIREPILLLPQGCAYWRRITQAAGFIQTGDEVEIPDEAYEAFYDRYFPDDIPDEWSAADQQKSHGRGLSEKTYDPPTHIIRDQISETEWAWGIHVPVKKVDQMMA